jgi:type IV secretion system protein VirB5
MKRFWIICGLLVSLTIAHSPARAQGIPVIDAASIAQQVQQVASWGQQLKAMASQYQQLETQYQALTGNRGYGNSFNNPQLQQYLPAEWQQVYGQIRQGGLGALSGGAQAIRQQMGDTRSCSLIADTQARASCQQAIATPYQNMDVFQNALSVANQKPQQIQSLISAIQTTNDPKAIAELQARIAGEQAAMQNEMLKVQLSVQLAEAQNKLTKEQAERDRMNSIRNDGKEYYKRLLGE